MTISVPTAAARGRAPRPGQARGPDAKAECYIDDTFTNRWKGWEGGVQAAFSMNRKLMFT